MCVSVCRVCVCVCALDDMFDQYSGYCLTLESHYIPVCVGLISTLLAFYVCSGSDIDKALHP